MKYDLDSNWIDAVEANLTYVKQHGDAPDERDCKQLMFSRKFPGLTVGEAIEQLMMVSDSGWQDGWTLQATILMWNDVTGGVRDRLIDAVLRNPVNGYLIWQRIPSLSADHVALITQAVKDTAPNLYKKMTGVV